MNPKDTARQLADQLQVALDQLSMPPARRRDLEELAGLASGLADRLAFIHDEHMLLDLRDSASVFDDAYKQWDVLEAGRIDGSVLERLLTLSHPLNRLDRAGIDIVSMKKFSAAETAFALRLGDNFTGLAKGWDTLKKRIDLPSPELRFQRQFLHAGTELVDALGALGAYRLLGYDWSRVTRGTAGRRDYEWLPFEPANVPRVVPAKGLVRARLEALGNTHRSLVTGEWLNAYAAHLVHDHLRRNRKPHEIYTNVRYEAPRDIIRVSGDFDVVVQAGDTIAVFECKSGQLDPSRDELQSVIDKASGLQEVIRKTGAEVSLTTLLLFNPSASDGQAVAAALAGTEVRAITPDEVRRVTMEIFGA